MSYVLQNRIFFLYPYEGLYDWGYDDTKSKLRKYMFCRRGLSNNSYPELDTRLLPYSTKIYRLETCRSFAVSTTLTTHRNPNCLLDIRTYHADVDTYMYRCPDCFFGRRDVNGSHQLYIVLECSFSFHLYLIYITYTDYNFLFLSNKLLITQ